MRGEKEYYIFDASRRLALRKSLRWLLLERNTRRETKKKLCKSTPSQLGCSFFVALSEMLFATAPKSISGFRLILHSEWKDARFYRLTQLFLKWKKHQTKNSKPCPCFKKLCFRVLEIYMTYPLF